MYYNVTPEDLQDISKSVLLRFFTRYLHCWEPSLPAHLKNDPDLRPYFYCDEHEVNADSDSDADQIDLPAFIRKECPYCQYKSEVEQSEQANNTKIQQADNNIQEKEEQVEEMETEEVENQCGKFDCTCDCLMS